MIGTNQIVVIDSIMGSGKTTKAMNYVKDNPYDRFMYITPYLDEIKRIKEVNKDMIEPRPIKGSKLNHIRKLTSEGKNIISTHALLSRFDLEIQDNVKYGEYTLILDEVANVVEQFTFNTLSDKEDFFNHYAYVDEEGYCVWDEDKHPVENYSKGSKFYDEMCLCINRNLINVDNTLLMWELPIEIFKKFKQVVILTYLFEGSVQKPYFDAFEVEYDKLSIKDNEIVPYYETPREVKEHLASLINICDSALLNEIGNDNYSLSSTWYQKNMSKAVMLDRMKKNLTSFFGKHTEAKAKDIMWSTFKDYQYRLKGKGYTKGYCVYNMRATNDYRECYGLAYLLNVYPHYSLTRYFVNKGLDKINSDKYALSILLQWIWRSRIRNGDSSEIERKIDLYLPSLRMRNLLLKWLIRV